jgi:hypothetical protein
MKSKKSNNANSRTDTPTPLRYDAPPSVVCHGNGEESKAQAARILTMSHRHCWGSDNQYESPGDALVM